MQLIWCFLLFLLCGSCLSAKSRTNGEIVFIHDLPSLNSRSGKTLLKKLHNSAAFLAGIKLGSYLNSKELLVPIDGHGSLASAHTFQLFGKTFSTALSLSYGDNRMPLPLQDPLPDNQTASDIRSPVQHVLVTVLDNPTDQTLEKLKSLARISENNAFSRNSTQADNLTKQQNQQLNRLIQKHNEMVTDLNKSSNKTRINSRF